MSNIGNVNAQGRSGNRYSFQVFTLDTSFKSLPGVYLFLRGNSPVYVGETGDLSCRFDGHHKAPEIQRCGADRIAVMVESSDERRLSIERDLLGNYKWPCNG